MKQTKKLYSTSQELLYTICLAGWNLCSQYLTNFANLKAFYTAAFITDAVQAVTNAKQLTPSRQNIGARKEARINLLNATKVVLDNWQLLKVYITKAFAKDMVETKLEVAGASLYRKAFAGNWSAVRDLIDTANAFIADNLTALTDNENMPPQFQAAFQTDGDSCIALSVTFFDLDIAKQLAVNKKLDANNAIYSSLIEMMKDGQQIFKDNEAVKKQFVFSYLVATHSGDGSASLSGYIVNANNQPVEGVLLISRDQKYKATTNAKGHYRIGRIAAGNYTFSITCPGYSPIEQIITFTAGTASKADFELSSLMKKVA
jgi:hypothetical protein